MAVVKLNLLRHRVLFSSKLSVRFYHALFMTVYFPSLINVPIVQSIYKAKLAATVTQTAGGVFVPVLLKWQYSLLEIFRSQYITPAVFAVSQLGTSFSFQERHISSFLL